MSEKANFGSVAWADLTVENAEQLRDFYHAVVGWSVSGVDMGGYEDFMMNDPETGAPVAGVCHARGTNAGLPPMWLIYVTVQDLNKSITRCIQLGGQVISGPRGMFGQDRYCVIRDPAGAALALFESAK